MTAAVTTTQVVWRRVGLYYAIAFGGAALVAGSLALAGPTRLPPLVATAAVALLYMPLPMVAGLVVERVARRRPLLAIEWARLRARPLAVLGRAALATLGAITLIVALGFLVAWLAGAVGVPGHGTLVTTDAALRARMLELQPALPAEAPLPPLGLFVALTIIQGTVAGFTINGLFALGEEYGWRGVLADELRPLGRVKADLLIGVLWGFWHAPIIMLGHNYGPEWGWGILVMVLWTVPLSFVLSWSRDWSGTVLAPAALHGAFNGVGGIFTLLIAGGTSLVNPPAGLAMAVVVAVVALVLPRLVPAPPRDGAAGGQWARP